MGLTLNSNSKWFADSPLTFWSTYKWSKNFCQLPAIQDSNSTKSTCCPSYTSYVSILIGYISLLTCGLWLLLSSISRWNFKKHLNCIVIWYNEFRRTGLYKFENIYCRAKIIGAMSTQKKYFRFSFSFFLSTNLCFVCSTCLARNRDSWYLRTLIHFYFYFYFKY